MTILKSKDIAEMQKTPRILLTKKIMSSKKIKSTLCQTKIISLNLTQVRWPFLTSNDVGDNKIHSDLHYKKKGEKDRVSNNFNACDTAQYKEQKQKKKSDLEYTKASLEFWISESVSRSLIDNGRSCPKSRAWFMTHKLWVLQSLQKRPLGSTDTTANSKIFAATFKLVISVRNIGHFSRWSKQSTFRMSHP